MLRFGKEEEYLLLYYSPRFDGIDWLDAILEKNETYCISKTFTLSNEDVFDSNENENIPYFRGRKIFKLGVLENGYYRISNDILGIKNDLFLFPKMSISKDTFIATGGISIFKKIDGLVSEPIIIGGDHPNAIPKEEFYSLLKSFPSATELKHYTNARIAHKIRSYFSTMDNYQEKLEKYIEKYKSEQKQDEIHVFSDYDIAKYKLLHDELSGILNKQSGYSEKDWQNAIANFLLLIFPKYIAVLKELVVHDFYSKEEKVTKRQIDFALVDASGSIDIIEIKKPFENCILSKGLKRDNYVPHTELSTAIMQVEKYIFHLSKWGVKGEEEILKKRSSDLPQGFSLNITNPKGIVLLGRDGDIYSNAKKKLDFEVIRRKYSNVVDIITYDDLLRRLKNTISMLEKKV